MRRAIIGGAVVLAAGLPLSTPRDAHAAWAHVVQPGESLSSVAAVNGLSTDSVAAYNGMASDAMLIEGTTIQIPAAGEVPASDTTAAATATATTTAHVVQPGESLSSVAAVNGLSTDSVAAYNGMASDAMLIEGTTIQIPAASDTTATDTTSTDSSSGSEIVSAPGMGHVPSPWGELHLDPAAADAWNAMREEALATYGIDIHPGGTLSAYRTYEQQAELYDAFLAGAGAPANPPGSSSHEYGTAVDLASPEMRTVIDEIGWAYGWGKVHGPDEWWHVDYVGG